MIVTRIYTDCKIVATLYTGTGLARSIGVDVFKPSPNGWQLCSNSALPWQGLEHYTTTGRPEAIQIAKPARILATIAQLLKENTQC